MKQYVVDAAHMRIVHATAREAVALVSALHHMPVSVQKALLRSKASVRRNYWRVALRYDYPQGVPRLCSTADRRMAREWLMLLSTWRAVDKYHNPHAPDGLACVSSDERHWFAVDQCRRDLLAYPGADLTLVRCYRVASLRTYKLLNSA